MSATDEERFRAALRLACGPRVPAPDDTQIRLMFAYYAGVVEGNRSFNLTRVVDPAEAAVKHFADALALVGWVEAAAVPVTRVLDVGTGAGFPAVPLAIMRPQWQVTAIDSTAKKVRFVAGLAGRLGLNNLIVEQRRAGEWKPAQRFDLVTCKAIGDLQSCIEQARDLVTRGGHLIVYKTARLSGQERDAGLKAARHHSMRVLPSYCYRLQSSEGTMERVLWVLRRR